MKRKVDFWAEKTLYGRAEQRPKKPLILMLGGEERGGTNFNCPKSNGFTVDRRINPEEGILTREKNRSSRC